MRKINLSMLVGSLLVSCLLPVARGQTGQAKKLDISLSKPEFVLSEDVMVSLTASNPTNKEITSYSPEGLEINENFIVTFEDGARLEYVGELAMGGKVIWIIRLMPGESRTSQYNLSRLFEIDKPGTYTVQAIRGIQFVKVEKDGKTLSERRDGEAISEAIQFKVLPLNIVYEGKETRRVWALRERHQGLGSRQTLDIFVHDSDEGNLKLFAKVSVLSTFFCKYVGDVAQGVTPQGLYDDDGYVHVLFQRPDGIYEYKKLHKYTGKVLAQEEIRVSSRLQRTADGDVELIRG